jgi:hypothetical protein
MQFSEMPDFAAGVYGKMIEEGTSRFPVGGEFQEPESFPCEVGGISSRCRRDEDI